MLTHHAVRLPISRTPKLIFPELFRRQPFREQTVQFFLCPCKTWHRALFDSRQSRLYNLLQRPVPPATYQRLNSPPLLPSALTLHAHILPPSHPPSTTPSPAYNVHL